MNSRQYVTAQRMWAEGETIAAISREIGCSVGATSKFMSRHRGDFPYRNKKPKRLTDTDVRIAADMVERGTPIHEAAHRIGVCESTLRKRMERLKDD